MKHPWEDIDSCSYLTADRLRDVLDLDSICGNPACAWYDATGFPAYRSVIGRCKVHPVASSSALSTRGLSRDEAVAMSVMAR